MFCSKGILLCIRANSESLRTLLATAQQPQSRDIFLNKKILPLDKLISQQERILAYKVINSTNLLDNILTDRGNLHHYLLRNDENLRIPLNSTTHSQLFITLFVTEKLGIVYHVILRIASSLFSFWNKLKLMLYQQ